MTDKPIQLKPFVPSQRYSVLWCHGKYRITGVYASSQENSESRSLTEHLLIGLYGGTLASGQQKASYVFCCNGDDPWLSG